MAIGQPESDIGNVETVLDSLIDACYYLSVEKTRYKFGVKENLNKRFADRRATVNGGRSAQKALLTLPGDRYVALYANSG